MSEPRKCSFCKDSPAPIHFAETDDGEPVDIWLCSACASWLMAMARRSS